MSIPRSMLAELLTANSKNASSEFEQGMKGAQEQASNAQQAQSAAQLAKLKDYLEGQTETKRRQAGQDIVSDLKDSDVVNSGGSVSENPTTGQVSIGGNPYARMMSQGPHQAQALAKAAAGTFKPINDQLDSSKATLDNLSLGNDTGDKLALINEAKLSLAGSGGRAVGQMVGVLAGDPTMASDTQKALNWLQNTPNVPKLQPAQRDAIRESVFNRLPQIEQQGTQAAQQLTQQAPLVAPQTDGAGIVNGYVTPATQKLQQLKAMQSDYTKQRQAMQPQTNQISSPSTANAAPTTLDKLKAFFGGGQSAAPKAPQPQTQQQVDPMDAAISAALQKKGQAALQQQAPQPNQQQGQGQ